MKTSYTCIGLIFMHKSIQFNKISRCRTNVQLCGNACIRTQNNYLCQHITVIGRKSVQIENIQE